MALIVNTDIKDLGFTEAMFNTERDQSDFDFNIFIDNIITDEELLLKGRIGDTAYASVTSPTKDYAKKAAKCVVAAEMVQRRINIRLAAVVGHGEDIDLTYERSQMKAYRDEANIWIKKIVGGMTTDNSGLASGVLETDHFTVPT